MLAVFGRSLTLLAVGLAGMVSCGGSAVSFMSSTAIERAETELREAREMKAPEMAPYPYTKADLYIRMSKERLGFADYQAAQRFAEDALQLAIEAKKGAEAFRILEQRRKAGPARKGAESGWGQGQGDGR